MEKKSKIEMILAGGCAAIIGTAAIATSTNGDGMSVTYASAAATSFSTVSTTKAVSSATENDDLPEIEFEESERSDDNYFFTEQDITVSVSFSAIPDTELSSDSELVFLSNQPPLVITVPVSEKYDHTRELEIIGQISSISDNKIRLTECKVRYANEQTVIPTDNFADIIDNTAPTTTSATKTTQTQKEPDHNTVYISSTGKIHLKSDCSGMKSYTEMDLDDALMSGFTKCKKCF